jgi:hypothetical protein
MADRCLGTRRASLARKDFLRPTNSDHEPDNELTVTENVNIGNSDFQCAEDDVDNIASDNNVETSCASRQVINMRSN